ncbi:MAG: TonB-dependent receptor plug domain-containing protein, partial [Gillisia sp.]|nr:TonB-dependent receptor plug domain-containing protein [Gillisia sp.]
MRSIFLIASFFFLFNSLQAQEITVLLRELGTPLLNVTIFNENKSKSVLTNFDGKAEISKFGMNEILVFKHVSHLEYKTTRAKIQLKNNRVYLDQDENMLQKVVLSVVKFAQNKQDIPQQIVSISSEEIRFSNAQTAADLLESSGQVFVQKSQLGGGSPMIRGFSTNRLLITVDGVRMNTAIFRSGNLQNVISIDPFAVGQAEVILGPGSVVYGSDAIGGVMNFYTLKPRFSMKGETSFSGNVVTRYATANNEKTVHADFNAGRRNWSFLSSITYSDFGDLKMGSHGPKEYLREEYAVRRDGEDVVIDNPDPKVQLPTGYDQINLLQKIAYMADDNWVFNLGIYYSTTSDLPRYDRLHQKRGGQLRSAEWYYGPQTWFSGNFQIDKTGNGKVYDKAQFTGAYQY